MTAINQLVNNICLMSCHMRDTICNLNQSKRELCWITGDVHSMSAGNGISDAEVEAIVQHQHEIG